MSGASAEGTAPRGRLAVAALIVVLAITMAWWALALWPLPQNAAGWVVRARSICFGTGPTGLPDAEGWIALIVQPGLMIGTLLIVWGRALRSGLSGLALTRPGRAALGATALALVIGVGAGAWRIQEGLARPDQPELGIGPGAFRAIGQPAPELDLIDQHGDRLSLSDLSGRPALVTFAFGHCETLCPLVVHNALEARKRVGGHLSVVVVTLDPWRDTPARLPYLADRWGLRPGDRVLSGRVADVERVLDRWGVPRQRDLADGDLAHPPLTYVLDRESKIAFATNGAMEVVARLSEGL